MSAFATIEVPLGTINAIGAILNLDGAVGPLSFQFQDIISKGVKYTGGLVASGATIRLLESDDAKTWTQVGGDITLSAGGEKPVSVISQKNFVAISGSTPGGGYIRADIAHRGEPFRGQVTVGITPGKRGLGKDYVGETATADFIAEPAIPTWPE